MGFIIGLLTFAMVLLCGVLILLVLIQLPKKEAGAGLASSATPTDAPFDAGSGTALTKITTFAATAFFVLALLLSILQNNFHSRSNVGFLRAPTPAATSPAPTPSDR